MNHCHIIPGGEPQEHKGGESLWDPPPPKWSEITLHQKSIWRVLVSGIRSIEADLDKASGGHKATSYSFQHLGSSGRIVYDLKKYL